MTYSAEVLADSPIAYYRLGETTGTDMLDSSGNGYDGLAINSQGYGGTYTLGTTGLLLGDSNKCVDFAAGNGLSPYNAAFNTSAFTIEARVNADNYSSYRAVATRDGNAGSRGWNLYILNGFIHIYDFAAGGAILTGGTALSTGVDYSVAMTYDGTTVKVYLNGVLDGSVAHSLTATNSNPILVAASYAGTGSANFLFDGRIDEVSYYGAALSATRLLAHHNASVTTSVTALPPAMAATAAMPTPVGTTPSTPEVPVSSPRTTSPITVRLGNSHITNDVSAVHFRKEAVGGVRNITLRLARPLDRFDTDLAAYSRLYVYDARSAVTIAEGRLSDFGRGAGTDGQQWDVVAFGPVQHASDRQFPYVVIDSSLERWSFDRKSVEHATLFVNEVAVDSWGHKHQPITGATVSTTYASNASYRALIDAGQKLGSMISTWRGGVADANYRAQIVTQQGISGSQNVAYDAALGTGVTNKTVVVVTDFPSGDDQAELRMVRQTAGTTAGNDDWLKWNNLQVRAMLLTQAGADITTGYTSAYVLAGDVVKDLLGRVLNQYDGTNATISTSAAHQIDQLAYPDGITAAQVLDDLMALEPAYYWTTGPSDPTTGLYSFAWKAWPTTVRYEVTLDDGGSFPASSQELWNRVLVRWKDPAGRVRNTVRTLACAILDNATPPVIRQSILDLGDDVGSLANAQRAGDNFLANHNVPANAGNLTISRPIRDLTTGAMVEPFEIEPGELIRVRGVESYPDALNASSNDGLTVFRIWSMEYDSDSNSAALELDTYSRSTANALARLITRRNRRR